MQFSKESPVLPLPLMCLNHVSFNCRDLPSSVDFYTKVLGFLLVKRPSSFNFQGAWLFNYGIGIHLLECKYEDQLPQNDDEVNPRDNHISFQCSDMEALEEVLRDINVEYKKRIVEDDGVYVAQVFFHDPDGYMIEICNCENLPIVPLSPHSTLDSLGSLTDNVPPVEDAMPTCKETDSP